MAELRTHHILSIAHLLSIGAGSDFVHTSTASLGDAIGRSQQSASAYLTELESIGYTKRSVRGGKTYVMVTKKGVLKIKQVSAALSKVLDSKNATGMLLSGKISSGVREGAYYMSLKKYVIQFKEKIGYVPYPGTLNISLDERSSTNMLNMLSNRKPDAVIDGFSDGKRTYGWVKCYKCAIEGKNASLRSNDTPDVVALGYDQTHQEKSILDGCVKLGLHVSVARLQSPMPDMSSSQIRKEYDAKIHDL